MTTRTYQPATVNIVMTGTCPNGHSNAVVRVATVSGPGESASACEAVTCSTARCGGSVHVSGSASA